MELHRILFPLDFSLACHAAAPFVKAMAADFEAEVIALHVMDMPASMFALPDASGFDMLAQLEALHKARAAQCRVFIAQEFPGLSESACWLRAMRPLRSSLTHAI